MEVDHDQRAAKGARNQALWRHVNERIERVAEDAANPEFICECADTDCTQMLHLTIAEYEAVRESPVRFPVAPGHVYRDFEKVVEERDGYVIVEKFGTAGDIAENLDPRGRE